MSCEIRKVKPEEVKTALDLALRVFMEYEAPIYSSEGTQKFIKDHIENEKYINSYISGRHLMLGAFDGKRIIGLVSEHGNGRISMVFVDKEYQHQGMATSIMERMAVALRLQGHNKITLISSPYALPFYKHFGFIETDIEQKKDGSIFTPMEYIPRELWDVYDKNRVKTGRIVERGRPMSQDEYHIVVHVWIKNSAGEYLISKRTPNKHFPNMWECTGGSAVMGENSLSAAICEAHEELGVILLPDNGRIFKQYINQHRDYPQFTDVWIFKYDVLIESVLFQEGETCDAMWASKNKIKAMICDGEFIGRDIFPYIDELLDIGGMFMNLSKYKKIILVGSGGSGKSWLAKRLADITGYRLIHLDCECWQPNWTKTPKEEWIKKQKEFIKGEKWIIDGNYNSSMELRFAVADLVVFLDINRFVCIWSVLKRRGKRGSDFPDYLEEKMNFEFIDFLKWIWTFPKTGKKRILDLHEKYPEKEFLVLKSRRAVIKFLETLEFQA